MSKNKYCIYPIKLIVVTVLIFSHGYLLTTTAQTQQHTPWSFGLIGDTQWLCSNDSIDQEGVSVSIIAQINAQFIDKGVKFVIQPGDLSNDGGRDPLAVRATAAQSLYDAGIGFYPIRGNHDYMWYYSSSYGINGFHQAFPQTFGEKQDSVPLFGAHNFSSPSPIGDDDTILNGISYSFDYGDEDNNARFVMIDVLGTESKHTSSSVTAGIRYGYSVEEQFPWISERLDKTSRGTTHAFVFSHQTLIGENHTDCVFSGYADTLPEVQNDFISYLMNNDVKYFIGAHDHMHNRSIVTSPDGNAHIYSNVSCGASTHFYSPIAPSSSEFRGQKTRQTQIAQEIYNIGFYIYTIDGPCVTVDYYSDSLGNFQGSDNWPDGDGPLPNQITPTFNFIKKDTWGYSLNGKEFFIAQGQTLSSITDNFQGTTMELLNGTNSSTITDYEGRQLTKAINTGWTEKDDEALSSDILMMWGMADFNTQFTDTYTIQLNYDPALKGPCVLMSKNSNGEWVPSVNLNSGGDEKFVIGPYDSSYELGTYGIDCATKTVWAVINHTALTFAAHTSMDGDQDGDNDIDNDDVTIVLSYRNKSASVFPSADLNNDGTITILDARILALLKTI